MPEIREMPLRDEPYEIDHGCVSENTVHLNTDGPTGTEGIIMYASGQKFAVEQAVTVNGRPFKVIGLIGEKDREYHHVVIKQ